VSAMDLPDFTDPYAVQAFRNELQRQNDETRRDLAERQERRVAGLDREWRAPQPERHSEPVRPQRQAFMTREAQAGWDDWLKAHIARSEHKVFHAVADTLGEIAREYDGKLKALKEELAELKIMIEAQKRELDLLTEKVLDMRNLLTRKDARDAA
jgi:hypothetical protein